MKQVVGLFAAALSLVACGTEMIDEGTETTSTRTAALSAPNPANVAEASKVADVMISRLFAALLQEFSETTADNAETNSKAISNIFFDTNYTMRLVGELEPLRDNDVPQDAFETDALAAALQGNGLVRTDQNRGWWVRKSVPVSTFTTACAHCHDNYAALPANTLVGALMVRARVEE